MKVTEACYPCLQRLVHQAAALATENPDLRSRAIQAALQILDSLFAPDKTSIAVATPLHRTIKTITGNPDPYFKMKQEEIALARHLYSEDTLGQADDLRNAIVTAVRGNSIDFFREFGEIREDLALPVEFYVNQIDLFERKLNSARNLLYLADNAGEVFFDLGLVRKIGECVPVTYVVKESPVQNDITLSDLDHFGLTAMLPRVITTGTDTPGVVLEMASDEFRREFETADLVLAKGMGYWETLSELPPEGKVFHLLKAKCGPVANSLQVPINSYVALIR